MIKKPCIGICSNATFDILCSGCGMSFYESSEWAGYPETKKAALITQCEYRIKHYDKIEPVLKQQVKVLNIFLAILKH